MPRHDVATTAKFFISAYFFLFCLALFLAYVTAHVCTIGAPFWDEWLYTDPHETLAHLFRLHNSHPLALGKLLFVADYYLFDGRGNFLRVVLWLELASAVAAATVLAWLSGVRDVAILAGLACLAASLLFSPFAFENLRWGFQVAWVAGLAGAALAIASLAMFACTKKAGWLWLSCAAVLAGMSGLASALLVPFILIAMAVHLRLPRYAWVALFLAGALGWAAFLSHYEPGRLSNAALTEPRAAILYVLRYLGGIFGRAASYFSRYGVVAPDALRSAAIAGLTLVVANSALCLWFIGKRERNPGVVGLVALSAVCIVTALATAAGRISTPEFAISSRYTLTGSLYATATVALAYVFLRRRGNTRSCLVLSAGIVALLLLLLPPDVAIVRDLIGRNRVETQGITALVTGVDDLRALRKITLKPREAMALSADFKREAKYQFADRWARQVGSYFDGSRSPACPGTLEEGGKIGMVGMRVGGTVDRALTHGAREILLVDRKDVIAGYGRVTALPSDLYWRLTGVSVAFWQGHLRAGSLEGISVYAGRDDGFTCLVRQGQ